MPSFFGFKQVFKGDPKTLAELRVHSLDKLQTLNKEGTFAVSMDAGDGQSVLAVSWSGDADKKDYWKLVKAKKIVKGKFKAGKAGIYEFTADTGSKAVLDEYLKDTSHLSIAFWNLIASDQTKSIKINDTNLAQRKLKDAEWVIAEWQIARNLCVAGLFDKPPITAKESTVNGKKGYATANGLFFAQGFTVKVKAIGKMVDMAGENPHTQAYVRDPTTEVFKPLVEELGKQLAAVDANLGKEKDPVKRAALLKQANDLVAKFSKDGQAAISKKAEEQWFALLNARVDYRDYQVKMTVDITVGSLELIAGAVAAGVGGITGVGAVLGLVGTIKGGLETATTIYTVFRATEGLGEEINTQLGKALLVKGDSAGWADFGKAVLGNVPGGQPFQALLAKAGAAVKSADQIEKDLKNYRGKLSGELTKASNLGKTVSVALKQAEDALKVLEAKAVQDQEKADPVLKKRNDALRGKVGKGVSDLRDKIGDLSTGADVGLEKAKGYDVLLKTLKDENDKNKISKAMTQYFVPLLNLPWGIDPKNISSTVMSASSVALDMLGPVLDELKASDQTKDAAGMLKTCNDLATGLKGLAEAFK